MDLWLTARMPRSSGKAPMAQTAPSSRTYDPRCTATTLTADIADKLLTLEDATQWTAVKPSWAYKQKAWTSHVGVFLEVDAGADHADAVSHLKSLTTDILGAIKPNKLAAWFIPATATWMNRCAEASLPAHLVPVIDALDAAIAGEKEPPAWLSVPKMVKVEAEEPAAATADEGQQQGLAKPKRSRSGEVKKLVKEEVADEPKVKLEVESMEVEAVEVAPSAPAAAAAPRVAALSAAHVPTPDGGRACPDCNAGCAAEQEYCGDCGARVQRLGSRRARGEVAAAVPAAGAMAVDDDDDDEYCVGVSGARRSKRPAVVAPARAGARAQAAPSLRLRAARPPRPRRPAATPPSTASLRCSRPRGCRRAPRRRRQRKLTARAAAAARRSPQSTRRHSPRRTTVSARRRRPRRGRR